MNTNTVYTKNGTTIVVDIFARAALNRRLFINDVITNETAQVLTAQLLNFEEESKVDPVELWIDSPGGSVNAGMTIINVMELVKYPIKTVVLTAAYSMAAVILMAGNERAALSNSTIMLHQASLEISGTEESVRSALKSQDRSLDILYSFMSSKLGLSPKEIRSTFKDDVYLSAQEALEYKIIDKIVGL